MAITLESQHREVFCDLLCNIMAAESLKDVKLAAFMATQKLGAYDRNGAGNPPSGDEWTEVDDLLAIIRTT